MSIPLTNRQKEITAILEKNNDVDFFTTKSPENTWPPRRRLLILDSSFNPPTKAHVNLFQKAREAYPPEFFDASLLLFSINNADKQLSGASITQRVEMMELVSGEAAVGCTRYGRFIDKAKAIKSKFPETELYFILGYDTMVRLLDQKYYETTVEEALQPFFQHSRLICADREPYDENVWLGIQQKYGSLIKRIRLDNDVAVLSSTAARKAIESNDRHAMESLMPPAIVEYILQQDNSIYLS